MRVLITCDRYPAQVADGLTLRVINYLRQLHGRHQFDLLCVAPADVPVNPEIEQLVEELILVQPEPPPARRGGLFQRIRSGFDIDELYLRSDRVRDRINAQCQRHRYDLIWDAGCNLLLNLREARLSVPLLADQVDDAVLPLQRQLSVAPTLYSRLWLYKQVLLQKRFGKLHIANAGAVLFVSQADADSFQRFCPGAKTHTIANGVDLEYFSPVEPVESGPQLVFEGVMGFSPNIDAALYLCNDILPAIRRAEPAVRLTIVGRDPAPEVQALAAEHVQVTGRVPDIRPYMKPSSVFVCPMRMGAGIKNKILQAWAMGMAVVSTPEGAMGLPAIDGQNLLLCDSPESFAQATVRLLRDGALRARLGQAGRTCVEREFSWQSKAHEFEALMFEVAQTRPRQPG